MSYDNWTAMSSISSSEYKRRLGGDIDDLLEGRPAGISRVEAARALQIKAAVILAEEQSRSRAAAEFSAVAAQLRRGECFQV